MNIARVPVRVPLVLSALVGGVFCTLADLIQKSEASAVLLIGTKLSEIIPDLPLPNLIAIGLVLVLGVAIAMIFESKTKARALYLGGSVLAILMTAVPYKTPQGFKTDPKSVEVNLSISTQDGRPVSGAVVTLWDVGATTIISRTRTPGSQLRFFQGEGNYQLTVELSGYQISMTPLALREGSPPQSVSVILQPSSTPLIIQRILR